MTVLQFKELNIPLPLEYVEISYFIYVKIIQVISKLLQKKLLKRKKERNRNRTVETNEEIFLLIEMDFFLGNIYRFPCLCDTIARLYKRTKKGRW